jgi:protein SCO1/2
MKWYSILISSVLLFSCSEQKENKSRVDELPYYSDAYFTPHWFSAGSDSLIGFHQIPDFSLINQNGESFTEKNVANKIYVVNFFFTTCPGICPKMTANLKVVQDAFTSADQILLLSHTVTPEIDSLPRLKEYALEKEVNDTMWQLLTGDRDLIYDLGRNSYFVEEDLGIDKPKEAFLHTENFVLIDQNRHIRGIYNGLNSASVNQLIADMKLLLKTI